MAGGGRACGASLPYTSGPVSALSATAPAEQPLGGVVSLVESDMYFGTRQKASDPRGGEVGRRRR